MRGLSVERERIRGGESEARDAGRSHGQNRDPRPAPVVTLRRLPPSQRNMEAGHPAMYGSGRRSSQGIHISSIPTMRPAGSTRRRIIHATRQAWLHARGAGYHRMLDTDTIG